MTRSPSPVAQVALRLGWIFGEAAVIIRWVATWFTSDLHLGHRNILEYCNRPWSDVAEMNRGLIDGWNALVAPDDTVFVLGDFAMGTIAETLPLASELVGRKVLVAGNHDRCWHGHGRRAQGWTERYLDAGFDEIVQGATTLDVGRHTVTLCHFPYEGDSGEVDRFVEYRPTDDGGWILHGHVHDTWAVNGRMINVGVDVRGYQPVALDAIADLIDCRPVGD